MSVGSFTVAGLFLAAVLFFNIYLLSVLSRKKKNEGEDSEQESFEEETYYLEGTCDNCEEEFSVDIPLGKKIEDHKEKTICENCGCLVNGVLNEERC